MKRTSQKGNSSSRLKLAGILFQDVKGFSKLTQHQLERYIESVLPDLAKLIDPYRPSLMELNTWGDAIIAVSENPVILARLSLDIRDYFRRTNFETFGLPNQLQSRISLHAGTVKYGDDPIRRQPGIVGSNVNLAARIEPIIIPGEVWVTHEFSQMLEPHAISEKLAFDDLGSVQLAKGYGSRKLLRLRRVDESPVVSASTEAAIKAGKTLNSLRDAYDVVGIGALNTDYIATAQSLKKLNPGLIAEHEQFFELGKERPASKEEVTKVIQTITRGLLSPCLGGSSFNTIHALASALPDLRLSFIGVAGASDARRGFTETLQSLDVDTKLLKSSEQQSGICVSYISRGERSLLTWPGVNLEMAEFLRENRAEIIATLGRARLVHVTSLFDAQSPAELAGILREAKYQNPWLQISFDPGHDWVRRIKTGDQSDPIREIMDLSTYLFLNQVEFELLGNDVGIKDDQELAEDIFEYLTSQTILILLKRYDEIRVFHRLHKRVKEIKFSNEPLAAAQIEDATGAGDVFAAGLFIAILVPGLELRDGVNLGLHLVRKKLLGSGCSDYPAFARIVDDYIDRAYANSN